MMKFNTICAKIFMFILFSTLLTTHLQAVSLDWQTEGGGWTAGDLSKNYTNVAGSGVDMNVSIAGTPAITATAPFINNTPSADADGLTLQVNYADENNFVTLTMTFSTPVKLSSLKLKDFDTGTYVDRAVVTGLSTAGNTVFPSGVVLGTGVTQNAPGDYEANANTTVNPGDASGQVDAKFEDVAVTQVSFTYRNGTAADTNPTQQFLWIDPVIFEPVPVLSATKTSNTFGTLVSPGDTIDYNITVTNALGTATDVTVSDVLPAGVTYVSNTAQKTYPSTTVTAVTQNNDTTTAVSIPDNQCPTETTSIINVPNSFTVTDVNVGINMTHTWKGDMRIWVTSPTGTKVNLVNRLGGVNNNNNNYDTLFDSDSPNTNASLSGTQNTATPYYDNIGQSNETLNAFDGQEANGNWTISYCDAAGADTGTFNRASLQFTGTSSSTTIITDTANAPTNMVTAADNIALNPGETLTVTYQVTVDDPLAPGITDINNTASITSAELTSQLNASVSDVVKPNVTNLASATGTEGTDLVHNVTLSHAVDEVTTYALTITDNNTTAGADYNATALTFTNGVTYNSSTGIVTVPAGVTSFSISVPTIGNDGIQEPDESYTITLGGTSGTGTIQDDGTVPITVSYAYPQVYGSTLELDFSTATETNNIGFNVYAITGKGKKREWVKLNSEPIDGALNSEVPLDYHASLDLPQGVKIKKIGIAGVDVNGVEDRHGPFKVGKESGSKTEIVAIDWKKIKKEYKKDKKAKQLSRKATKKTTKGLFKDEIVNIEVKENAVYRVTHETLLENNIDMTGINANKIAISFKGEAVERHIAGLNKKGKWTKDSYLEFVGKKPQGQDALYLEANSFRLSLDKKLVLESGEIEPLTSNELVFETNNVYGWTSPGADPFFDKLFYVRAAGETRAVTRTFELAKVPQSDVKMTVYVGAYSNATHHLQVSLNGSQVADVSAQAGWRDMPIEVIVNGTMLQEGSNSITITAIGESNAFDVYTYDKLVLFYDDGEAKRSRSAALSLSSKVNKKSIRPKKGTNYVIVSHPMFMTDALDNYISEKESEGWKIHLANVEDIYEAYGYGMATPEAIKSYLKEAKDRGVTHVQLVGSASYDYLDTLNLGSVSFIGSMYVPTGTMTRYTPCDSCLVADETGLPQLAIGRWPVRTAEEVEAVVNKSLSWKNSGQSQAHSALFVADKKDEANNLDFGKQQDVLLEQFKTSGGWSTLTSVYFDEYAANNGGDDAAALEAARIAIQQSLGSGASITSYSGHSSLSTWSFKGMLKQDDIASISNEDRTTIALPLACYTTYADSPLTTTLAHQFLAAGEHGAVAVYGAASLSKFSDNGKSASKVIDYLLKGETIGEAVRKTKVDLGVGYLDVIRNSNLLGDVTLELE